jgi:hypothetical protein
VTGLLNCEYGVGAGRREGAHTEAEDGAEDEGCASLAKLHDSSRPRAHTQQQQTEANGELRVLSNAGMERRPCGGLPDV